MSNKIKLCPEILNKLKENAKNDEKTAFKVVIGLLVVSVGILLYIYMNF